MSPSWASLRPELGSDGPSWASMIRLGIVTSELEHRWSELGIVVRGAVASELGIVSPGWASMCPSWASMPRQCGASHSAATSK